MRFRPKPLEDMDLSAYPNLCGVDHEYESPEVSNPFRCFDCTRLRNGMEVYTHPFPEKIMIDIEILKPEYDNLATKCKLVQLDPFFQEAI